MKVIPEVGLRNKLDINVFINKTEVEIKNGQSRDTGNMAHKRHRSKTNRAIKRKADNYNDEQYESYRKKPG